MEKRFFVQRRRDKALSARLLALLLALLIALGGVGALSEGLTVVEEPFDAQVAATGSAEGESAAVDIPVEEEDSFELGGDAVDLPGAQEAAPAGDAAAEEDVEANASANVPGDPDEACRLISYSEIRASVAGRGSAVLSNDGVVRTKADIVFVIDSTGSMSDEINNVINNLNKFMAVLDEGGVDYRAAIIDFKDWEDGEQTRILTGASGSPWSTSGEAVAALLGTISVDGGGDNPETAVDALGCLLYSSLTYRSDASKFAILLTDATYKDYNSYGLTGMADIVNRLAAAEFYVSVICPSECQSDYRDLYTRTEGIWCDIYSSSFSDELIYLAEFMKTVARPVDIRLETVEEGVTGAEARFTLKASVTSTDTETAIENMKVSLTLPEGVTLVNAAGEPLDRTIASLAPGALTSCSWQVKAAVPARTTNYEWSVSITSDSFAAGMVCRASDTFAIAGSSETYAWLFSRDSYPFENDFGGSRPYYVAQADFDSFIYALSDTDRYSVGIEYGVGSTSAERYENFLNNNLVTWEGSCYGMSLSAALFKTRLMNPADFGGTVTHDLPLSATESMINVLHMSQMTAISSRSRTQKNGDSDHAVLQKMYEMGRNISSESSSQQPYLVRLRSSRGGHAVVCYGAEEGAWTFHGDAYDRRLLIADPNYNSGARYIYISPDYSHALYSSDASYTTFGYRTSSLSELNNYAYGDMTKNYAMRLALDEAASLVISNEKGRAVIISGHVVEITGDFAVEESFVDSGDISSAVFLLDNGASPYEITPYEAGDRISAVLSYDDFSTDITGKMSAAKVSPEGSVSLTGADENLSVTMVSNDSAFDVVTIEGKAAGDVDVTMGAEDIDIKGEITNYSVSNMDSKANVSGVMVDVSGPAKASMEKGEVVVRVDTNDDGEYETKVVSGTVTDVFLNDKGSNGKVSVEVGDTLRFVPNFLETYGWELKEYKVSKKNMLRFGDDGLVEVIGAGKKGKATVKVTAVTTNKKKATVSLNIVDPYIPSKVSFQGLSSKETLSLTVDESLTLTPVLEPATARATYTWKSKKPKVASVADGVVTGLMEGKTTITATTHNQKKVSVKVEVLDPYKPSQITLDGAEETLELYVGETDELTYQLFPETAHATVTWKSSKPKVVSVDSEGNIEALRPGKAKITVTTQNKKKASISVSVLDDEDED